MSSPSSNAWITSGKNLKVGNFSLKPGDRICQMKDSTDFLEDPKALRKALDNDGYVLLRGVLEAKTILGARKIVVDALDQEWKVIDKKDHDVMEAKTLGKSKGFLLTGYRPITHHKDVLAALESERLCKLFGALFQGIPTTFNNKWVRVQSKGQFTDEHSDYFRFKTCATSLYVCWIPLGNYTPLHGTLAICSGSHKLPGYNKGDLDMKSELPERFEEYARTATWRTSSFDAGDILIMDIRTVHASTENTTSEFRISMDTRWQPAAVQDSHHYGFKVFSQADCANG